MGISDQLHILRDCWPNPDHIFSFTPCFPVAGLTISAVTSQLVPAWAGARRGVSRLFQPRCGWCWQVVSGRASWSTEIPALKYYILPLVFADTPAEDVITCSCKDWFRAFYRDGVKISPTIRLLRYPFVTISGSRAWGSDALPPTCAEPAGSTHQHL